MMLRSCLAVWLVLVAVVHSCCGQGRAESKSFKGKPQSVEEMLLFFPSKYPSGDWNPAELRFKDVFFTAADGVKLHGWYCECEKPRGAVLLAHGNAGNVASRAEWLRFLQDQLKVSVFIFDYRGYGRSEGKPTIDGALQDARAAREQLRDLAKVTDAEMLLMGESLGGAIVVQLAAESAPRGLILQSTFSSLRDVADVHYPRLSWLVSKRKLNSVAKISEYRGPLFQSHGNADSTIPFSSGQKLFQSANEPKQFFTVENADHNDWLTDAYLKRLEEFLGSVARPAP